MQKVLIADRDPETREWYANLVRRMGHLPLMCEDAIAVLDVATSNPDLDLVLMDVDLPGAWGEQLIQVVHGLAPMEGVPIIVASAPRSQSELMRLLANGARRWFKRPPAAEELMEAIQECLDRSGALSVFDVDEAVFVDMGETDESWLLGAAA